MNRQVEVAHGWAVNQSARDHDPAGKCLGNEEHSHYEVDAKFLEWDFLCEQKIENRNRIHQSSKTRDEAMDPFDIENVFVFIQGHIEVDLFEFRRLLIFSEFLLPGLLAEGWKRSTNGIPFRDRKSRARQTDESTKDNKKRHAEGKCEEPEHHGAVKSLRHVVFSSYEVAGIIAFGEELHDMSFLDELKVFYQGGGGVNGSCTVNV